MLHEARWRAPGMSALLRRHAATCGPAQNLILHIRNNRRGQSRACIQLSALYPSAAPTLACDGCIVCSQCDNGWTLDSVETRGHTGHVDNTNICSGSPNIDPGDGCAAPVFRYKGVNNINSPQPAATDNLYNWRICFAGVLISR